MAEQNTNDITEKSNNTVNAVQESLDEQKIPEAEVLSKETQADTKALGEKVSDSGNAGKSNSSTVTPVPYEGNTKYSTSGQEPHKSGHGVLIGCLIGAAVLAGAGGWYAFKAQDYRDKFIATTTINGIDVSGMTVEQAEAAIAEKVEDYEIQISLPNGTTETLSSTDVGLKYDSDGDVENRLSHQIIYLWGGKYIGLSYSYEVAENYTIDEEAAKAAIEAFPEFDPANYTAPVDAHMQLNAENKIEIVPETDGNELDADAVVAAITSAVANKEETVTIDESYYLKPAILSDDQQLNADADKVNAFLDTTITITLHDSTTYTVDAATLKDWLTQDAETGEYSISDDILKSKATEIAADIASKDNATYTTYPFHSTLQGTVNMPCGEYGCTVDEASTADEIYSYLTAGGENSGKPVYSQEISYPVGNTYAEVDIIDQMVYLYVDGNCIVSSSCVSGTDTDPERMSDRGIFYVTWMATNYTMLGPADANGNPSYSSFTNYAVFYNGGEALHDAPWRDSFGGTTYLYSGSHGCINLPYTAAQTIYNNAYVGMPVIVFG